MQTLQYIFQKWLQVGPEKYQINLYTIPMLYVLLLIKHKAEMLSGGTHLPTLTNVLIEVYKFSNIVDPDNSYKNTRKMCVN